MKRPELRVEGNAFSGKRFAVPPAGLRLGRSSSNDIPIRDEELSRNHCLFEQLGESGIRVTDLASANGTFVNEKRLGAEAMELNVGDVVRVGDSFLTVVGEGEPRVDFDLGLGDKIKGKVTESEPTDGCRQRSRPPFMNVLWGIVILALGVAAYLMLQTPTGDQPITEALDHTPQPLVEMRYEKVEADSESIYRFYLSLTPDGALHVAMDDLKDGGRHINRSAQLSAPSRARLLEILMDDGLEALDREYVGLDEDPPKLNSWSLRYYTTSVRKSVKIVNTQEPDAFRRVREKLEAFSMNELGIQALHCSREKLLEMAHAAADTGRMKWEDREVEHGNLYASILAYREAITYLETVNPKPPEFNDYVAAKERATQELEVRYKNQRFVAEQATRVGDWEAAKNALRTLCEMVPDREDDRNREAATRLLDVEKRLGKKGGR